MRGLAYPHAQEHRVDLWDELEGVTHRKKGRRVEDDHLVLPLDLVDQPLESFRLDHVGGLDRVRAGRHQAHRIDLPAVDVHGPHDLLALDVASEVVRDAGCRVNTPPRGEHWTPEVAIDQERPAPSGRVDVGIPPRNRALALLGDGTRHHERGDRASGREETDVGSQDPEGFEIVLRHRVAVAPPAGEPESVGVDVADE